MSNAGLENHCTQTAWSSQIDCCQRGHKIYSLSVPAVKKGTIFVNIYFGTYSVLIIVTYISSCVSAAQRFM